MHATYTPHVQRDCRRGQPRRRPVERYHGMHSPKQVDAFGAAFRPVDEHAGYSSRRRALRL